MRHAVVRRLKPFLDRSRDLHGTEVQRRWASDFGLGFLTSLVTLAVQHGQRDFGSEALGLVQVNGWAALTELEDPTIGTRVMLLSSSGDAEFAAGCRAALVFDAALHGTWPDGGEEQVDARGFPVVPTEEFAAAQPAQTPDLMALWERLWAREVRDGGI